jgi:hypothetical protein
MGAIVVVLMLAVAALYLKLEVGLFLDHTRAKAHGARCVAAHGDE